MKKHCLFIVYVSVFSFFIACDKDVDDIYIPVEENQIEVTIPEGFIPFQTLSSYNFFKEDIKELNANDQLVPYKPISPLFSDYALKKRFVYIPKGQKITYDGDGEPLIFPIGSVIIKNFYYDNVLPSNTTFIVETRLMFRTNDGWTFAEYFWNDEQTEAFLDEEGFGGFKDISWIQNGEEKSLQYRMPSLSECFICHKKNVQRVTIGLKPQSLNNDYIYKDGSENQLQKWINLGILENNLPNSIISVVDYNDPSQSLDMRVRSYVDINCASCHSDGGHCSDRPIRFAFDKNETLINRGVCIDPDHLLPELLPNQKIISPGDPANSVLFRRISTNQENIRMPFVGRKSLHVEGIALIEEWILSLTEPCE